MAITVDQSSLGQNSADSGSSVILTTTGTVAVGGTILIWWSFEKDAGQTFTSISGGGLTWDSHEVSTTLIGNYVIGYSVAYAALGLGSSSSITLTLSASAPNPVIFGSSFNGVVQNTPIDDDNHNESANPAANSTWTGGTITTTQSGDLVAAASVELQDASRSNTPGSGYTETHQFARGTDDTWTAVYQVVGSAGDYTPGGQWDNADANGWGAIGVALKEQPVPATTTYRVVQSNLRWG